MINFAGTGLVHGRTIDLKAAADNAERVPVVLRAWKILEAKATRGYGRVFADPVWASVVHAKVFGELTVQEALLLACADHLQQHLHRRRHCSCAGRTVPLPPQLRVTGQGPTFISR